MRNWRDVPLFYGRSANDGDAVGRNDPKRVELLREYRDAGCIELGWLCTAQQMRDNKEPENLGPRPEEIDWSGFPDGNP